MILPIRTSIRPRRTPYANYALILVNAVIFLFEFHIDPQTDSAEFRPWVLHFMLTPVRPYLWQYISYAFLHGGLLHIVGNMFFLYLFGNNVNDRLGMVGYLCFYLAGAVFSGIGHSLMSNAPVLGASGAVAAVTGAYLVLFPQTLITVIYVFFFIGSMELPALYFIIFKLIVWDNLIESRFAPAAIAYGAHLAGYAFGVAAILSMLATGLLAGSSFDLWAMLKRWNQRRRYRDVVASGYDPFTGRTARSIRTKEVKKTVAEREREEKISALRNGIGSRIEQRNLAAAAALYLELMAVDETQVPPRQYLLDIANQLASEDQHGESARAYERFLAHYGSYEHTEQVELMLGILYSRYLDERGLAIKHLEAASEKLTDAGQIKMCRDELAKLRR
jgi:membrane associated rhomboid family serine protease